MQNKYVESVSSAFKDITKSTNLPLIIAGLSGGLGVTFGALGAHAFLPLMDSTDLKAYQVANQYHLIHSIAMMLVAAAIPSAKPEMAPHFRRIYALFAAGTALLSFPQYLHSVCHRPDFLKRLTVLGGVVLVSGWCYVAAIGVLPE